MWWSFITKIIGRDNLKLSSDRILKLKSKAEVLQSPQVLDFLNQDYRQEYRKIIKRWNL